jgi:hypothetical protein
MDIESVYDNWQYTSLNNRDEDKELLEFDWKQYLINYPDLKNDGIKTRESAWNHWISQWLRQTYEEDSLQKTL